MLARLVAGLGLSMMLLPVLPVVPASAASFDCSKASTAFERAICDNPDLSALDDTLAIAYATAIGGLSKTATNAMREDQRDWLDYAGRACTADAEPQESDYTEEQAGCLQTKLSDRIRDLEQSRMLAGRRIYMDESFTALKADMEETGSTFITVASKIYSSPRIDGSDATATEFNAFAASVFESVVGAAIEGTATDRLSDVETRLTVSDATSSRITITINDWWYAHGAAHGNSTISYAHFLTAEGRALMAEDVFATEGWGEPLAKLAHDALKASLGEYMWDDLDESLAKWVAETQRWTFADQGLVIQFEPYEVTAYAGGAPTVTIPWAQLEQWTSATVYGIAYY